MPPIPKTKKIELLAKLLHKRFKGLPVPPERTVLEHLIYAALLENASFEQADAAYAVLVSYFIDWNEIRVATVRELADTFSMLPDSTAAGDRVRRALQGVFEKMYMFDLEELRKKGKTLGQAVDFLHEIPACTRFMVDYTTQVAFGGHVIPLDEASLRVFRLLGLTQVNKEGTREDVPGLERAIPKKNGVNFFLQLHHFAAGFFHEPESKEFRAFLKPVDADVLKREWTPPVLVAPKTTSKPVPQRPLPVVTVPFAPPDDDDFEEEPVGTEAEFLPDESSFRQDEREVQSRNGDVAQLVATDRKKGKEPKEKKKMETIAAVKSPISPQQEVPKTVTPMVKTTPTVKQSAKQSKKKASEEDVTAKLAEPIKKFDESRTPPSKKPHDKEPPKSPKKVPTQNSANSLDQKPPEKPQKSSTRKLREKKPK